MKIEQYKHMRQDRICKRLDKAIWALLLVGFILLIAAVIHTHAVFVPQFMEVMNG